MSTWPLSKVHPTSYVQCGNQKQRRRLLWCQDWQGWERLNSMQCCCCCCKGGRRNPSAGQEEAHHRHCVSQQAKPEASKNRGKEKQRLWLPWQWDHLGLETIHGEFLLVAVDGAAAAFKTEGGLCVCLPKFMMAVFGCILWFFLAFASLQNASNFLLCRQVALQSHVWHLADA